MGSLEMGIEVDGGAPGRCRRLLEPTKKRAINGRNLISLYAAVVVSDWGIV